jgi:hypothetical protein
MKRLLTLVFVAVWGGSGIGPAMASPLNLVTGLSGIAAPGESSLLDIAVTNQAPGDVTDFNAFLISFQLLPQPGATGGLVISIAAHPASNAFLTDPGVAIFQPQGSIAPATVNGSSGFVGVSLFNNDPDDGDFLAAGGTANLVTLTLSATEGTAGTWMLYAITNAMPLSAWQSTTGDQAFGNLPIPGSGFNSLLLGTVAVAPVPEPGAMLFPSLLGIFVIRAGRRAARRLPQSLA